MVEKIEKKNTVLFDLDNTLYDHYYSLRNAMTIQRCRLSLNSFPIGQLIDIYNGSLQKAYDRYLRKEISYEETGHEKVSLFFHNLNLSAPGRDDVDTFLTSYDKVYFSDRRAAPGAIETLVRLNEHGFRIGVVTNGQTKDQRAKMEAIGMADLIDAVFTSEEVGYPKPSKEMFQVALEAFNTKSGSALMVGDDIKSDIEGALNNGIDAVLYNPISRERKIKVAGVIIPVIHHMKELLSHLGLEETAFVPSIKLSGDTINFSGFGIDIVTAPRHCMSLRKETIRTCFVEMSQLCLELSEGKPISALARLKRMMIMTAHDANLIDENRVEIIAPGLPDVFQPTTIVIPYEERKNSIRIENFSGQIRLMSGLNWAPDANKMEMVLKLFQGFLDKLSIDHPRAGIRLLRDSFYLIAEQAGIDRSNVVIRGEGIED